MRKFEKYQRRPQAVEAIQWKVGLQIDGVRYCPISIFYSADNSLYYVTNSTHRPTSWVGVEKNDDEKYEVLPFSMYKVRAGREVPIDNWTPKEYELFERYIKAEEWPDGGVGYALIMEKEGGSSSERQIVHYDDWIIRHADGSLQAMTPQEFEKLYQSSGEPQAV